MEAPRWRLPCTDEELGPLQDEEKRPLLEGRAPAALRAEVPMELRTCPYPGSRKGHEHLMNVSALRQVSGHFEETLEALAQLRWLLQPRRRLDVFAFWHVTRTARNAPYFHHLRSGGQPVPVLLASVAKVAFGFEPLAHDGALGALISEEVSVFPTTDEVLARIEQGPLIGRREVCAATPRMIEAACDVLFRPQTTPPPLDGSPWLDRHGSAAPLQSFARIQGEADVLAHHESLSWQLFELRTGSPGQPKGRHVCEQMLAESIAPQPPAEEVADIACLWQLLPPSSRLGPARPWLDRSALLDLTPVASRWHAWLSAFTTPPAVSLLDHLLHALERRRRHLRLRDQVFGAPDAALDADQRAQLRASAPGPAASLAAFEATHGCRLLVDASEVRVSRADGGQPLRLLPPPGAPDAP